MVLYWKQSQTRKSAFQRWFYVFSPIVTGHKGEIFPSFSKLSKNLFRFQCDVSIVRQFDSWSVIRYYLSEINSRTRRNSHWIEFFMDYYCMWFGWPEATTQSIFRYLFDEPTNEIQSRAPNFRRPAEYNWICCYFILSICNAFHQRTFQLAGNGGNDAMVLMY